MVDLAVDARPRAWWRGAFAALAADPRVPFAALLSLYAIAGFTFLGFNRTPLQMLVIVASGCALDHVLGRLVGKPRAGFPLSAYITSVSLALLLNYAHASFLLLLPVYIAIGSKYVLTYDGRHVFNPSMFGVAICLLVTNELITAAPAYQWAGGRITMSAFVVAGALALFVFRVGRGVLIVAFLVFYAVQTALRAYVLRFHLPPETLFVGTLSTPAFFIFTFYMITDPATSPKSARGQLLLAFALALVDLLLHFKESVFTFFYAALTCASARFLFLHARAFLRQGPRAYLAARATRATGRRWLLVGGLGLLGLLAYRVGAPAAGPALHFAMTPVPAAAAGIVTEMGPALGEVDARVAHVGKWLLAVGDAVAVADFDRDGRQDLIFTQPLKARADRVALYRNAGGFRFQRVAAPELAAPFATPAENGLAAGATAVDWDGDGDVDLALAVGFGKLRLFENQLVPSGRLGFVDASARLGVDEHTISLAVTFFDYDRDGRLDLLVSNAIAPYLRDYPTPTPLNVFALPPPAHPGDRRMLRFMHESWHDARNGGPLVLYRGHATGFRKVDAAALGLTETHWSVSIATGDLDRDGFSDIYVANDFGPDDLYMNRAGAGFERVRGTFYGDVGRDTYKGMNSTLADFDRNGYLDVYVSNNHHALQSEGSLLWMVRPDAGAPFGIRLDDEATRRNALNERRWGWGAAAGDLDRDGWLDLVQANGMVDDRLDRRITHGRKDYWYVNHKLMQAAPEIHGYADAWGDLRGREIYPNEARRVYLNRGAAGPGYFADVAAALGIADPDCSRGVALADLDDDGDLDLVVTNQFGAPSLYRNDQRGDRTFLGLALRGAGPTHASALGTRVEVGAQVREVTLLTGFSGQSDGRLFFGLPAGSKEVPVTIRWYGGAVETRILAAGRYHEVTQ